MVFGIVVLSVICLVLMVLALCKSASGLDDIEQAKREMCEKAIKSDVCPHDCDICAWKAGRNNG